MLTNDKPETQLQTLLQQTLVQHPTVHSAVLRVDAPNFTWKGAAGYADPNHTIPMMPDTAFRSASVGKMILAAALLSLVEDGLIELDAPAVTYIPDAWLRGLSTLNGQLREHEITVRQLINHTSGIADYFSDGQADDGQPPFILQMMSQPDRLWDPREIVAWTGQHLPAHFPPGEGWHYSDTGFLIAGLIIESVSGLPLHQVYRQRLFEPLGMAHTYLVFREPPTIPHVPESAAYAGELVYTEPRTVSADWAGGGLVTTVDDLTRFIQAVNENRVFRNPVTRQQMMSWIPTGEAGVYYGLGVRRFVLSELGESLTGDIWGHTGALNVIMLHYPAFDVTVTGTLNQSDVNGVWSQVRPVAPIVPDVLRIMSVMLSEEVQHSSTQRD